ncbi:hypothetical protein [Vibrio sp. WXL103]|uniref:hypothetical protein n=1 Tax=unclassified Vibrio TaxID=2614977 RepID=UPI003EC57288
MVKPYLLLLSVLLIGCADSQQSSSNEAEETQSRYDENGRRRFDNEGREIIWVDDYNYYIRLENGDLAARLNKAEIWPLEDISDESSYDMPRVQFSWMNSFRRGESIEKLFSMKIDGSDLRLVIDKQHGWGGNISARRSPDNRYLAYGQYESSRRYHHYLLDLKTQERIELGSGYSPRFIWAEDSSYVYYQTNLEHAYKYTIATKTHEPIDRQIGLNGVIIDDKRYQVSQIAAYITDEFTGDVESSTKNIPEGEDLHYYVMRRGSTISPDGKYAWGSSGYYNFWFDLEQGTVTTVPENSGKFHSIELIVNNGEFVTRGSYGQSLYRIDHEGNMKKVRPMSGGVIEGASPKDHSLYNTGNFDWQQFVNGGEYE